MDDEVKISADRALLSPARSGAARGRRGPGALPDGQSMDRGSPTPGGSRDEGPNVPVISILLSVPVILAVGLVCLFVQPGLLVSLLAIGLTPVLVFCATLAVFLLRERARSRR